jgi:hypothetical protein
LTLTIFLWVGVGAVYGLENMDQYYPLQVGNVWSYLEQGDDDSPLVSQESILQAVQSNNNQIYLFGELDTGCWIPEIEAMAWDEEGLKFFGEIDCEDGEQETLLYDPPILMLPRDLDIGETSSWTYEDIQFEILIEGRENVTVHAGTFENCLKIRTITMEEEECETCEAWHVQSLGPVKEMCTFEEDGQVVEQETMELIAAVVNGTLTGNPLEQDESISFKVATASASQCGLLVKNIVLKGSSGPELWWAGFVFDINSLNWVLHNAGQGSVGSMPEQECPLTGLDFTKSETKIFNDDMSGEPRLYMLVPFQEQLLRIGFQFNMTSLSWDFLFVQEHDL